MHGRHTARALLEQSALVRERVEAGRCGVVVLAYQLVDGRTHVVAGHGVELPAGLAS
jgi:hypothetical protein